MKRQTIRDKKNSLRDNSSADAQHKKAVPLSRSCVIFQPHLIGIHIYTGLKSEDWISISEYFPNRILTPIRFELDSPDNSILASLNDSFSKS